MLIKTDDLDRYLEKWVRILALEHWTIKAKIVRAEAMLMPDCGGENRYNSDSRESWIFLRHPADWPETEFDQDMELILVHELLHLTFSLTDTRNQLQDKILHRCICDVASALIKADRRLTDG